MKETVDFVEIELNDSDWENDVRNVIKGLQWLVSNINQLLEDSHYDKINNPYDDVQFIPKLRFPRGIVEECIPDYSKVFGSFENVSGCKVKYKRIRNGDDISFPEITEWDVSDWV